MKSKPTTNDYVDDDGNGTDWLDWQAISLEFAAFDFQLGEFRRNMSSNEIMIHAVYYYCSAAVCIRNQHLSFHKMWSFS